MTCEPKSIQIRMTDGRKEGTKPRSNEPLHWGGWMIPPPPRPEKLIIIIIDIIRILNIISIIHHVPASRRLEGVRELPDAVEGRQVEVHDGVRGRVHVHVLCSLLGLGKVAAGHDDVVSRARQGVCRVETEPRAAWWSHDEIMSASECVCVRARGEVGWGKGKWVPRERGSKEPLLSFPFLPDSFPTRHYGDVPGASDDGGGQLGRGRGRGGRVSRGGGGAGDRTELDSPHGGDGGDGGELPGPQSGRGGDQVERARMGRGIRGFARGHGRDTGNVGRRNDGHHPGIHISVRWN